MTRSRFDSPQPASVSTLPFGSTTFVIAIGFQYTPPAAMVAYADASSSGVTSSEPSVMDGNGSSGEVRIPRLRAIATLLAGATSSASRAYTVLSDCTVALATDSTPE